MSIEIKVPQLPESVADATLVAWHKKAGDSVERDVNLVDLETDKVVLEVPAPATGRLKEIRIKEGSTVTAGDVIAILEEGQAGAEDGGTDDEPAAPARQAGNGGQRLAGDAGDAAPAQRGAADAAEAADAEDDTDDEEDEDEDDSASAGSGRGAGEGAGRQARSLKTSPAVRRLLDEHDLDATMVAGSGRDGRITKADVMAFLKSDDSSDTTPGDTKTPTGRAAGADERTEERVPMSRLRARIAERLVEAQQTAAMLTTFNEVDLTEVTALRTRYKESFEKEHGVRLGFMSFFAKAAVEALKKFPVVNASVEGSDVIYHNYYDIGIAVSTERGLMVPVIRDVDRKSFAEFEKELGVVASRAQSGKIGMDELTGGTFSITNGGIFGSMMSTPILNQPQSAILGMHAIQQRPVAIDGNVVIRPMMYLALTYDHRLIDGKDSVQFLVTIKQLLEDPSRLLLQV
ncbi:MAG TPA: 2-oxoglutarate dehydrogenase complex dihydrolipoyllysine-residue succinyltransferase, partial [Woeseiaceae bacterium]|nr:2-oxoglutarate dehydrogenase complex dihydrolipoyllysine-residue succinyltransferase [Woeseiaceae bacterium]